MRITVSTVSQAKEIPDKFLAHEATSRSGQNVRMEATAPEDIFFDFKLPE